jgi:hypothetical protein
MSNKISLTIPTPCHENWDNMTPVEKGRFCGSCQTQVVDFSNMTDLELVQFFKKPSTGSVCGRFMTGQLHREIEISKKRTPWLRYFFQMALPALFISKTSGQNKSDKETLPVNDTTKMKVTNDNRILGLVLPTIFLDRSDTAIIESPVTKSRIIKGRVTDEKENIIPFATVTEINSGASVMANEKGEFLLSLKNSLGNLLVTCNGYESKKINISELPDNAEIKLDQAIPDGTIETSSPGTYIKGQVDSDLGSRGKVNNPPDVVTDDIITRDIDVPVEKNRFYVYPNPIKPGGALTLGVHLLEEGYYTVSFTSQSRKSLQQKELWIDNAARVLTLDVPNISPGVYVITLVNKKTGKSYTDKFVIQ